MDRHRGEAAQHRETNTRSLNALACPVVGSCVLVGTFGAKKIYSPVGLIETLNGGTWIATEAPIPSNASSRPFVDLDVLAWPTMGWCIAAGNYTDTSGNQDGLIETLSGGTRQHRVHLSRSTSPAFSPPSPSRSPGRTRHHGEHARQPVAVFAVHVPRLASPPELAEAIGLLETDPSTSQGTAG
jgi:hypothetical protein